MTGVSTLGGFGEYASFVLCALKASSTRTYLGNE